MPHADVLDERESLSRPVLFSIGLHAGLFAAVALTGLVAMSSREQWGDPKSLGGGAVGISAVETIPLPARAGIKNPVANDTESVIPSPPKEQVRPKQQAPEPDAIAIRNKYAPQRTAKTAPAVTQTYRPYITERPNQVYSNTGQAAVSGMYSQAPGGGGVGSGSQSPFGYGFGWYAQLIREKVARNWNTSQVDPRVRTAPEVVVAFDLARDGSVRNVRISQSSGNFALDQSAMRAVAQSSPFQQFPPQMPKDAYTIDLVFRLSR